MAKSKLFSTRELTRWAFLALAVAIFFIGPRLIVSVEADDIQDVIDEVKIAKMAPHIRGVVLDRLKKDKKFVQENEGAFSIFSVKTSSVNWLAFFVLAAGFLLPLGMKYIESKKPPGPGGA